MVDWTKIGAVLLSLGYLAALTYSLVKWDGFRTVVKKHAGLLILLILLGVLFIDIGGGYAFAMVILFTVFGGIVLGIFAGPVGFLLGLYFGFFFAIYLLLASLFA